MIADRKETWGFGQTQCSYSFPQKPKLRDLQADQNYKGSVWKTQRRSRTSSCQFWWLDNSRPQGPKRQLRVSKQSSMRNRGRGSSYSMDPGISVQKQNFTRSPEKLAKVPGTREETKSHLADNSLEFGKACEDLSWNHCTSTPHRSETNGIAERAVRRVKEGTSAVLLQSGLNESWWADSMECETYLRNVTDLLFEGKTPYEWRFGQPFNGPIIPFGSLVEYHPITAKDQSRIHRFCKRKALMIIGTLMVLEKCLILGQVSHNLLCSKKKSMDQETCRILGQFSPNLLYWKKKLLTDICGPGERFTRKLFTSRPHHLWPELWGQNGEALPQSCENSCSDSSEGQGMGKNWRKFRRGTWPNLKIRNRWSMKQGQRAQKFILPHWWTSVIWKKLNWRQSTKSTKVELYFRVDIVKNNSGSYAVFTEQGSSAFQMTAAKIMDIISRLSGCDGQAADAVSAHTQIKMEDAHKLLKIPKSECPDIWIRLPRHTWPKSWSSMEDPVVPLERNLYGHPLARLLWEKQFEKILLTWLGENSKLGMSLCPSWKRNYSYLCMWMTWNWLERNKMWKVLNKEVDLGDSWIMYTWAALNVNAKWAKILWTITEPCSNREFPRGD